MFKLFKTEKEYNYFAAFQEISLLIVAAADLIVKNLEEDPFDSLEKTMKEIEIISKSANHQKKELLQYLYEDFLPPIERKDIIALTHSLDRILKKVTDVIIHLDMYQIKIIQAPMNHLMKLIQQVTFELPHLMKYLEDFKHPQKIMETLEIMGEINAQGAQIYYQGVKSLNLGEMNSFETMKYTRMYESFNEVFQSIEELMNTAEAVIIENT